MFLQIWLFAFIININGGCCSCNNDNDYSKTKTMIKSKNKVDNKKNNYLNNKLVKTVENKDKKNIIKNKNLEEIEQKHSEEELKLIKLRQDINKRNNELKGTLQLFFIKKIVKTKFDILIEKYKDNYEELKKIELELHNINSINEIYVPDEVLYIKPGFNEKILSVEQLIERTNDIFKCFNAISHFLDSRNFNSYIYDKDTVRIIASEKKQNVIRKIKCDLEAFCSLYDSNNDIKKNVKYILSFCNKKSTIYNGILTGFLSKKSSRFYENYNSLNISKDIFKSTIKSIIETFEINNNDEFKAFLEETGIEFSNDDIEVKLPLKTTEEDLNKAETIIKNF